LREYVSAGASFDVAGARAKSQRPVQDLLSPTPLQSPLGIPRDVFVRLAQRDEEQLVDGAWITLWTGALVVRRRNRHRTSVVFWSS
jgi:hypothetical protein